MVLFIKKQFYSLSGILKGNYDKAKLFKVQKGLFKNSYTVKFKFDASDSDLNDSSDSI